MWIEKEEKRFYVNSAKASGLRLFYGDISKVTINEIKQFVAYIRKRYYFPIRCNIYFSDDLYYISNVDGHKFYGVFYGEDDCKKLAYPQIYVASRKGKLNSIMDILFALIHELTHYYQWYFYEDKKRTDHSLEIEANKWARYLLQEWKKEKLK